MLEPEMTDEKLLEKLKSDKAKILWFELKHFFARGTTVGVSSDLDLVEIAFDFSKDNKEKIERLMQESKIAKVTDEEAQAWYASDAVVWAVVVAPWVLVQKI